MAQPGGSTTHFIRTLPKVVSFPTVLSCITRTSHLFFQRHKFQGYALKSRWSQRTDQQHNVDKSPVTAMLLPHKLLTTGKYLQVLLVSLCDTIRSYSKLTEWYTLHKGQITSLSGAKWGQKVLNSDLLGAIWHIGSSSCLPRLPPALFRFLCKDLNRLCRSHFQKKSSKPKFSWFCSSELLSRIY